MSMHCNQESPKEKMATPSARERRLLSMIYNPVPNAVVERFKNTYFTCNPVLLSKTYCMSPPLRDERSPKGLDPTQGEHNGPSKRKYTSTQEVLILKEESRSSNISST